MAISYLLQSSTGFTKTDKRNCTIVISYILTRIAMGMERKSK